MKSSALLTALALRDAFSEPVEIDQTGQCGSEQAGRCQLRSCERYLATDLAPGKHSTVVFEIETARDGGRVGVLGSLASRILRPFRYTEGVAPACNGANHE